MNAKPDPFGNAVRGLLGGKNRGFPVPQPGKMTQATAAAPPQPNDQQPQGVTCDGLKSELAMLNSAAVAARVDQQLRPKIEARKLYLRQKIAELGCNVNK